MTLTAALGIRNFSILHFLTHTRACMGMGTDCVIWLWETGAKIVCTTTFMVYDHFSAIRGVSAPRSLYCRDTEGLR